MDDLVQRLSQSDHRVVVGGPKPSLEEFQQRVTEMGALRHEKSYPSGRFWRFFSANVSVPATRSL
jgi:hypothetical protein